jgi:hypothetical protein
MDAGLYGSMRVLELLIAAGADLNSTNDYG